MPGHFIVQEVGEGTCSVCGQWGPKMLNAALNSPHGAVVIGSNEGVPREACPGACVEKMVEEVLEASKKRHGHSGVGPPESG